MAVRPHRMRRARHGLVLVLALALAFGFTVGHGACSAPSAPPAASAPSEPPMFAPTVAPTVARVAGELRATGLPAVSADGSTVVYAQRLSDGLRHLPNLTLAATSRADQRISEHVVLSVAEADQLLDDAGGANPALDARVAAANRWLADRHRDLALVAMTPIGPPEPVLGQQQLDGDDLRITWDLRALRITDGTTALITHPTPASWQIEPYTNGAGSRCEHLAYLAGAHVDRARRVALVRIGYAAPSDLCAEPSDQLHVIAW